MRMFLLDRVPVVRVTMREMEVLEVLALVLVLELVGVVVGVKLRVLAGPKRGVLLLGLLVVLVRRVVRVLPVDVEIIEQGVVVGVVGIARRHLKTPMLLASHSTLLVLHSTTLLRRLPC